MFGVVKDDLASHMPSPHFVNSLADYPGVMCLAHRRPSMNVRISVLILIFVVSATLAACGDWATMRPASDSTAACHPTDGRITFALSVAVRDSMLGTWLTATVRAQDGAFSEELVPGPGAPGITAPLSYFGVADRPGTYTVTVTAPGYRPWRRDGIIVASNPGCHVATVGVTVLLQPAT